MTGQLCRFALATSQPLSALLELDMQTLLTLMATHADMVEQERQ